ncbi:alpha/beta fold hydrolase [Wenzhouxiangella sp. AB-CW3]|uniref:alpha/beta fold hydrolase n=1 Tax=Wenzhouxiangella sp. AB-CW3 TaxID=2771012 RepID=UPI00168B613D|nr:YqiA/YcfP family alpha/beta fold hydrolase [Wenzhouxiangella sp. AB-CW3]QOC23634.1 alpha/beta fold hydrolase [Wenzhouxiangella sp. AB-CW3]
MKEITVIFSHGHLSSPESNKIVQLAPIARARGFRTEAIDYRDLRDDPVGRARRLVARLQELDRPAVLVGSSMGGYVSMAAAEQQAVSGLFLMAPALFLEHYVEGGIAPDTYRPRTQHTCIVHGWRDEIIPWRNSLRHARQSQARLHLLDADHALHECLPSIAALLDDFLQSLPA